MKEHILRILELKEYGRPIGKVSEDKLLAFITEAEMLHIKPTLGDDLYLRLLNEENWTKDEETLVYGGVYHDNRGEVRAFMGLKVAIAYFVYAQNLMAGDLESTRYGTVFKNGDYSTRVSAKERSDAYANAMEVANGYLQECVEFCKAKGMIKSRKASRYAIGGVRVKKIG